MLSFGHVYIQQEEFVQMSRRGNELYLVLDWPHTELPMLFDLPELAELRFDHLASERVGLPLRLQGWKARRRDDTDRVTLLLRLADGRDDGGPPTTP